LWSAFSEKTKINTTVDLAELENQMDVNEQQLATLDPGILVVKM